MGTRLHHVWNGVFHTLEVLIILLLLVGGVSLFFVDVISSGGPVARVIGSQLAAYLYGTVFISEALALAYAKVFRKKTLHRIILFTIYVTMLFTIILEIALTGFSLNVVDNIFASVFAGYCWLRWKFLTEYIDPALFHSSVYDLKYEQPPSLKM